MYSMLLFAFLILKYNETGWSSGGERLRNVVKCFMFLNPHERPKYLNVGDELTRNNEEQWPGLMTAG